MHIFVLKEAIDSRHARKRCQANSSRALTLELQDLLEGSFAEVGEDSQPPALDKTVSSRILTNLTEIILDSFDRYCEYGKS
jgi:hypothetical protein